MAELEGRVPFDKGNYHHAEYENLIKVVVPLRRDFALCRDPIARIQIATVEFQACQKYLQVRKDEINSEPWGKEF